MRRKIKVLGASRDNHIYLRTSTDQTPEEVSLLSDQTFGRREHNEDASYAIPNITIVTDQEDSLFSE